MKVVLVVNNLKKYFGSVKAVDGLSFNVKPGEIYGLLGPNGAGKSTTIKSILGLLEINSGSISVFGDDPIRTPTKVKKNIGYVPEELSLYESMTVAELLNFVASLRGLNPQITSLDAEELLKSLNAKKYYDSLIASLSQGNKQKIQIICALLHKPKLLILDEPLSGLDARSSAILKELFRIHIENGGSILFSTHIMEQAQVLCTRIGIINQGKLVAEGTFEELQDLAQSAGATLEEVFLKLTDQDEVTNGIIANLKRLEGKT
ncbi:MAG: ABC transporter ATP-binding protein [Candidatus Heimdallarchaeota archaeon]|nr:MAG: ABC transporter ATP-binding protein [Candidatus Heimdallarchaeota archaeon]